MLRPKNKKLLKKGSYSLAFTVVILAIAVFLNLLIGELPSSATKIDVSENKLYSIGDETKNVASSLTEDVTLYLLAEDGSEDATLNELLTRYADLSSHIKYEKKDPVLNPSFASSYTDEDLASNSVIVVSDKRSLTVICMKAVSITRLTLWKQLHLTVKVRSPVRSPMSQQRIFRSYIH